MILKGELSECPYVNNIMKIMMRYHRLMENGKEVSELGAQREWADWWRRSHFDNPFDGMKVDR